MRDIAILLKEAEYREYLPAAFLYVETLAFVEYSRDVFVKSATGDVCNTVYVAVPDDLKYLLYVNPCRSDEYVTDSAFSEEFFALIGIFETCIFNYLSDK